ncbi:MAG: conjugal transfer protein TraN [Pseudomonadota bacterium]|nr:conjugal transfer protein TraN [Pseudomonadota bacterium]
MIRYFRNGDGWRQLIAGLVSALVVWTPFSLSWADAITDAGAEGQAVADLFSESFEMPGVSSSAFRYTNPNGERIDIDITEIYRDANSPDVASWSDTYGDEEAAARLGYQARADLLEGEGGAAAAYQSFVDSRNNLVRPDLSHDPIWSRADRALGDLETFERDFADCDTTTTLVEGGIPAHVPDIRHCTRARSPFADCEITHDYTIPFEEPLYEAIEGAQYVASCGEGCIDIRVGTEPWPPGDHAFGDAPLHEGHVRLRFPRPGLIRSARLETVHSDAWEDAFGGANLSNLLTLNGDYVVASGLTSRQENCWPSCSAWYWPDYDGSPNTDLTHFFKSGHVDLGFTERGSVDGSGSLITTDIDARYRVRFEVPPKKPPVDLWYPQSCIDDALKIRDSRACGGEIVVSDGPDERGCVAMEDGRTVCEGSAEVDTLKQPPLPGVSRLARTVSLSNVKCFYQAAYDTCQKYQDDAQCGFFSAECRSEDEFGNCLLHRETYDCGVDTVVPTVEKEVAYQCAGPVRCLGDECFTPAAEQSQDFTRAVAALQTAQFMKMDTACDSANLSDCKIFQGVDERCKVPLSGDVGDLVVNCCDQDAGVGLGGYVGLLTSMAALDSAMMSEAGTGTALRAGWETLRSPVTNGWGSVKGLFANRWDALTGTTQAAGTEAAKQGVIAATRQQLVNNVATWVGNSFGTGTQSVLFTESAAGSGVFMINPVIVSVLYWVAIAYAVYTIVLFVINWAFKCEESDFRAVYKNQLKNCHYVGAYCSDPYSALFISGCWEDKQTYCCFNSPLSRIVQEQIRPQLGIDWGTPEYPNCQGLSIAQIQDADWSRVDLDEWLGILNVTGNLPSAPEIDIERLTGAGSALNVDGNRADARTRTIERIEGIDTDRLRRDARDELRDSLAGALK